MLTLYRSALRLRRTFAGPLTWLSEVDSTALVLARPGLVCAVNLGPEPIEAPDGAPLLLSGPLVEGRLPPDTAG